MNNNTEKTMLSKKELRAVDALNRLGIPRIENRILLCLFKKEGVTSRELERIADLRQPEVSTGTNALINKGWIKIDIIKRDGKGRPYYKFHLAKPKKEILNNLQEMIQKRMEKEKQDMQILSDLWE